MLTPEQVERMLAHTGVRHGEPVRDLRGETMLRCACEAGLRKGEIIALTWGDVLFEDRRLRVGKSIWQGKEGRRVTHSPKSGHSRRVAISPQLAELLGASFRAAVIDSGAPADGYVWPGRNGRSLGRDSPSQYLARVLIRAGLATPPPTPEDEPVPFVSFHGLRHTAAARAFAQGVPLIAISRQLGHASPAITAKVYARLHSDSQLNAFAAAMSDENLREPLRDADPAEETA